jgi:hypothetical protein
VHRAKRAVHSTASGDNKPVAPPDLWSQLDALVPDRVSEPPANGFTVDMFAKRKSLSAAHSCKLLRNLHHEGKLNRVKVGGLYYYTVAPQ